MTVSDFGVLRRVVQRLRAGDSIGRAYSVVAADLGMDRLAVVNIYLRADLRRWRGKAPE